MNDKQIVAQYAAKQVEDNMLVGLGTGSTADYFIAELARRTTEEGLQVSCVASSIVSMLKAQELGLNLVAIEHLTHLDLYVDGADEVTPDNTLLKGQGADLVKEKLLATSCDQFIVLIDKSKKVDYIGENFLIPIEVMPFSWKLVMRSLKQLGGNAALRQNSKGNGLAVSSYGSLILDVAFEHQHATSELNTLLNAIPGIVEHGIFYRLAKQVLLSDLGVVQER